MPSVSSVELTNTFDDWRNRTNDIVTEINKANSVDPNSAIVFANSTSGFQVAEVVSDSVTGTSPGCISKNSLLAFNPKANSNSSI